ncbi:cellulase family glycosylhydrolase [Azospirillum oleiclasticum]|uniref:cellulase n=4 Tax=Azospirillum oleiclasticum TaxID=2735135 RepID=A0ABX2TGJ4_9PROT|nr:carbohydrate-binding domain-containing protein [Azospirillum oleiclasticum]NYZ22416.1 cellulase family glycosylhydrolase [Azospirillum oleiclasticum]
MATTDTALTEVTFAVNAWGNSAGGVAPRFTLRVDGKDIGQATVASADQSRFTFKAKVAAGEAHKVEVVYDNDGTVGGAGRDLFVRSIEVGGKTIASTSSLASYETEGQGTLPGREGLWWNGALSFDVPASDFPGSTAPPAPSAPANPPSGPVPGTDGLTVKVNATADLLNGEGAHFKVLLDGKTIGEATASTTAKAYSFTADGAAADPAKLQIQFDNDEVGNGTDRNLYVRSVEVDGKVITPTAGTASYDRYELDGKDMADATGAMYWNGTLAFDLNGKGGTPDTPPTPANPPAPSAPSTGANPTVTIADAAIAEPASRTVAGGIADGPLSTRGNQIIDSSGKAVKLTGVNWFGGEGYAFVPNGLWADSYQGHMDKMKDLGFNLIRLPYSDAMLDNGRSPNGGIDYSLNPDLRGLTSLQVFDKIIEYADKIGMKIMLDHHRSGDGASANENGLWYTDQYPESVMIKNWQMLAERYADNPSVVAADLHNEPHGAATWGDGNRATDWAAAAERIGNAIQKVNPDLLLMVEGIEIYQNNWDWWGGNLMGAKDEGIDFNVDNKLVYAPHSYGPGLYQMSWFNTGDFPNNLPAKLTESFGHLFKDNIAPILIGEFGGRFDDAQERAWINKFVQYVNGDLDGNGSKDIPAGDQGMSWTYWSWNPNSGDTGGILNDDWTSVDYTKFNAIKPALFSGSGSTTVPGQAEMAFTVTLSKAAAQTVTLDYTTTDGTAKAGQDYVAAKGTLSFAPGETTKQVKVTVLGDSDSSEQETFGLKLSNPEHATIGIGVAAGNIVEGSVDLLNHVLSQIAGGSGGGSGLADALLTTADDVSNALLVDGLDNDLLQHAA